MDDYTLRYYDCVPSQTRDDGEMLALGPFARSGVSPNVRNAPTFHSQQAIPLWRSSILQEDIPQPSIETEAMDTELSGGLFVTPEPEEKRSQYSTSLQGSNASFMSHRMQSPASQVSDRIQPLQQIVLTITDDLDSDDDLLIVDEAECSSVAREKWSKTRSKSHNGINDPAIKKEPGGSPVTIPNIRDVQRRLIQQHYAKRKAGASTVFGSKRAKEETTTPKIKSRRTTLYEPITIDDSIDVQAELEAVMRHEDNSWMEGDHDAGEVEELNNLTLRKKSLEKRQKSKMLSEAEAIELMRLEQQIELQNRRQQVADRRPQYVPETSMFVSKYEDVIQLERDAGFGIEDEEGRGRRSMYNQAAEDEQMARAIQLDHVRQAQRFEAPTRKSGKKPTKGRSRKVAKTAREVENNRREKEREKERKKKNRLTISNGPSSGKGGKAAKSKALRKAGNTVELEKKQHKSRMRNRWDGGADLTLQTVLQDLVHNDFMAERQAQGDYGEAPEIHETTKEKQLKALLSSVPDDYDTHKAKTQHSDLLRASRRFGYGQVKAAEGKWKLNGMKTSLYHHQLLGADWMVSRELGSRAPFGGLLADAMGMGKTLETLATMVGNPPSMGHIKAKTKATLLVIPSSAIRQWIEEIGNHVEKGVFPRVLHYKASKEIPLVVLQDCDIVLTSYGEVMNSFPFPTANDVKEFSKKGGYEKWLEKCKDITGDLHRMEWYRIVLDEAHSIKNYKSRTSLACQNLRGRYRWALSATPIQNRLDELFPYFRFLRSPWTSDYPEFRKHFCDPDADDAYARIDVMLSIVIRRTMKDHILGRPIIELPLIHSETKFISFSLEERALYRLLEDRFRDNLNRHLKQATAQKNYNIFMVMLLRLRQCTAHPFLLESALRESLTYEDLLHFKTQLKPLGLNTQPIYEQIKLWVQESEEERNAARERGEPTLDPGEKVPFGRSDFGKYFRMGKFLESLDSQKMMGRAVCRLCGDLPHHPRITDCNHIFCGECLINYMHKETSRNGHGEHMECPDQNCRKIFTEARPYSELNRQHDDDANSDSGGSLKSKSSHKGKSSPEGGTWLAMCRKDPEKYLLPSAKMIALKAQILKWVDEAPNDKILVFTQFRMMAKIIGLIAESEKWEHILFTGDMDTRQRHTAIQRFHANPDIKLMIAGLKCGGQALNLTCANRVISVDLWWNHSCEQQAFGRVFRIGQHKETFVTRLVIKNSVDGRLLDMQADKVRTVDRAMQDTGLGTVDPLSMEDLVSLFGHLRKDDDGTFEVVADYENEEDKSADDSEPGGPAEDQEKE